MDISLLDFNSLRRNLEKTSGVLERQLLERSSWRPCINQAKGRCFSSPSASHSVPWDCGLSQSLQ